MKSFFIGGAAAIVLVCIGCGTKPSAPSPPAQPIAVPRPGYQAVAPTKASSPAAAPGKTSTPAQPVAEQPLLTGQTLANLAKDFTAGKNDHADLEGTGKWTYFASAAPNPWEALQTLKHLDAAGAGSNSPGFQLAQPTQEGVALTTITKAETELVILPPDKQRSYAVMRWTSGVSGDVVIQGKFQLSAPPTQREMEAQVFVDGILAYHTTLLRGALEMRPFRIATSVRRGSTVDFVVGMHVFLALNPKESNAVGATAAIVRTGDTNSVIPPEMGAAVASAWRKEPRRPFPKEKDVSGSIEEPKNRYAWFEKVFLGSFDKEYDGKPEVKADGAAFLKNYFRRFVGMPGAPSEADLLAEGKRLMLRGNGEPIANAAFSFITRENGRQEDFVHGIQRSGLAEMGFMRHPYPPAITFWFNSQLSVVYQVQRDPIVSQQGSKQWVRIAADDLARAASEPNLTNRDRQMFVILMERLFDPNAVATSRSHAVGRLSQVVGADPWIRELVLAREHFRLAWIARGEGFAGSVTEDGWRQFRFQLELSKLHALQARQLHPELPEPAALMIAVTMAGGGVAGEDPRYWFDEALHSDLACADAYRHYAWSLRPRWGGSHEQMLELARECLATSRFDTSVPDQYHQIGSGIAGELKGFEPFLKMPGVADDYARLLRGYAAKASDEDDRLTRLSTLAAVFWVADRKEEARQILEELGPKVKRSGFTPFGITYSAVARTLRDQKTKPETYFPDDKGKHSRLVFAPGSGRLLAAEPGGGISVWDAATKKQVRALAEHSTTLVALDALPGKNLLLTASLDGKVVVWNSQTLEAVQRLELKQPIQAAAWQPGGLRVVVACGEIGTSQLVFWDLAANKQTTEHLDIDGSVDQLAAGIDGADLYLSIPSGNVALSEKQLFKWSHDGGAQPLSLECFPIALTAWRLSPTSSQLLGGGISQRGNETGTVLGEIDPANESTRGEVHRLPSRVTSVLPLEGQRVAAVCSLGGVVIWDERTKLIEGCIRSSGVGLRSLTASDDESFLAAADATGWIHVWPLQNKKLGFQITGSLLDTNFSRGIRNMTFLDGDKLFIESTFGGISVWDWKRGCRSADFAYAALHKSEYSPAIVAPFRDGRRIAALTLGADQLPAMLIHDMVKGETIREILVENRNKAVALSPDGNILAIGDEKGTVTLYNPSTGQAYPWGILREHKDNIGNMEFTPDGSALLTSSVSGEHKVWDLPANPTASTRTPVSRLTFSAFRTTAWSISMPADASLIATAMKTTDVFDAGSGKLVYTVPGTLASFSPDGRRLLTGFLQPKALNSAAVWDGKTGKQIAMLEGAHRGNVTAVAVSPDGKIGLTGDEEGWIRAWDLDTGVELIELPIK